MKRTLPMISVVIPAYNAEHTIREAIASVLAQTVRDFEIIVCDDASSDQTADFVEGIDDSRIRLLSNKINVGEGASRDRAIAAARGDWIAVLDADDAWHPKRLEKLLEAAGTATDIIVFDDILVCHHTSLGLRPWRRMRGSKAFGARGCRPVDVPAASWAASRQFLIKPLIPVSTLKSLQVCHSQRQFSADTEFFLRLMAAGMKLRYLPEAFYFYRITPGSMSATGKRAQLMRDMLEGLLPLFGNEPMMLDALRRNILYRDFTTAIKSGHLAMALRMTLADHSLAPELIARSAAEAPYHLHRVLHGGAGRGKRLPHRDA